MELRNESFARILKAILSVALVIVIWASSIGLALIPAASRGATVAGFDRYAKTEGFWLEAEGMKQAAQMVWGFSVWGDPATLPETIDGREAFPADQAAHLSDVQRVLSLARIALVSALSATILISVFYARTFSFKSLGSVYLVSGISLFAVLALGAIAAVIDFGAFFEAFHKLFFTQGTWEFPANSLLIRCFPEGFWVFLGSIWLAMLLVLDLAVVILGILFRRFMHKRA